MQALPGLHLSNFPLSVYRKGVHYEIPGSTVAGVQFSMN